MGIFFNLCQYFINDKSFKSIQLLTVLKFTILYLIVNCILFCIYSPHNIFTLLIFDYNNKFRISINSSFESYIYLVTNEKEMSIKIVSIIINLFIVRHAETQPLSSIARPFEQRPRIEIQFLPAKTE